MMTHHGQAPQHQSMVTRVSQERPKYFNAQGGKLNPEDAAANRHGAAVGMAKRPLGTSQSYVVEQNQH